MSSKLVIYYLLPESESRARLRVASSKIHYSFGKLFV